MLVRDAIKICFDNGIKISPIPKGKKWQIEITVNGKTKVFDKVLTSKELNNQIDHPVAKTYIHYAKKLTNEIRNNIES